MFPGAGALVLGSFFSNFARSEFQVVQFIPLIITPQIVLCGIWWPLQSVPEFIRPFSYMLPLTYAAHALRAVMLKGAGVADILYPISRSAGLGRILPNLLCGGNAHADESGGIELS